MQGQLLQAWQFAQLLDFTQLADLVGMQVQHLQLWKLCQLLLNACQLALGQVQPS